MPHIVLEYSDNIAEDFEVKEMFFELHNALMKLWAFKKQDFKSRAIEYNTYFIGDGEEKNAFAALQIQIMSGKTDEEKMDISKASLEILKKYCKNTLLEKEASISVQILEIDKKNYSRIQS
ncbi:5-carboxymethyl-2-hydroxymuconate Delta-isomerase [Brenneria izbisi]|uniref:5-carboxymethyl-2-hydroxymuconate Delta-isomerase n=1 Tax=Brenneria izbisi TaxID=2939450 RepID=A0AA42C2K6_9GAMM|nr:5-carboxymethyl-2-hydroxymuconate Delta-isomerase [Brenneria izbisi]MCV9877505.1 5-carboxymethyl-2-hydroxymuconate Delta-isomerase [Brenneria izbisi]MCV9880929.1 5-carboxymethyl-2-hydroxymuconate Delta-isomerase [Brenneria izbisi]